MGFASGFDSGSRMVGEALEYKAARERDEYNRTRQAEIDARERERYQREQAQYRREDDAIRGLESLQNGVMTTQATGLSMPSAQMLADQGYAGAVGPQAVRAAAGDTLREERRMGLQPTVNPQGDIQTRAATDAEITGAAQRVALARRDMNAWRGLETERRAGALKDARQAEFKRISGMKPEELVSGFHAAVNDNPDMPAMVDYDKKSNRFLLVSRIPGVPSQSLSRAEMTQAMMGMWEAGNGDYERGMAAMISTAQNQRAMQQQDFERSRGLAKDNAGVYFKGREADNDDARTRNDAERTRIAGAQLGISRDRAAMERLGHAEMMSDGKGGYVQVYPVMTKDGIEWRQTPMPAGLRPIPKGNGAAPREVPAAGTVMQNGDGSTWQADGRGGRLAIDGVLPAKRAAVLSKAGFDKATSEQLPWTPDGKHIAWGGLAYDVSSAEDMAELRKVVSQYAADSVMAREVQSRGFAPRYPIERPRDTPQSLAERNRLRSFGIQQ